MDMNQKKPQEAQHMMIAMAWTHGKVQKRAHTHTFAAGSCEMMADKRRTMASTLVPYDPCTWTRSSAAAQGIQAETEAELPAVVVAAPAAAPAAGVEGEVGSGIRTEGAPDSITLVVWAVAAAASEVPAPGPRAARTRERKQFEGIHKKKRRIAWPVREWQCIYPCRPPLSSPAAPNRRRSSVCFLGNCTRNVIPLYSRCTCPEASRDTYLWVYMSPGKAKDIATPIATSRHCNLQAKRMFGAKHQVVREIVVSID
eukprot:1145401-Pelagomonas_calceolata.AAC.7